MKDARSKIDVRRLKVGELHINKILVHCALLGLVFLVLSVGRDQRPSIPATASSWEDTICLTRLPEDVNATISWNALRKTPVASLCEWITRRAKRHKDTERTQGHRPHTRTLNAHKDTKWGSIPYLGVRRTARPWVGWSWSGQTPRGRVEGRQSSPWGRGCVSPFLPPVQTSPEHDTSRASKWLSYVTWTPAIVWL